ncbi:hypothetical protein KC573_00990, partial [candidate division WWE3 bacterium]|nr:hypothetical protein [candidate division WWE3 bacterium]
YGSSLSSAFHGDVGYIAPWNTFHYYLNAKYFDELGYFDLYSCTLEADFEEGHTFSGTTDIRDLRTYELVSVEDSAPCPKDSFTPERWTEFKADVSIIHSWGTSEYWRSSLTDKGFNATPFWVVWVRPFANLIQLQTLVHAAIILNLDLICLGLSLVVSTFIFGGVTTSVMAIFMLLYFGTYQGLMGNLFQYPWLIALLWMVMSLEKKWFRPAGLFLAFATVNRIFPVVFVLGFGIKYLLSFKEDTVTHDQKQHYQSLLLSFLLGVSLFVLIGLFTSRGLGAWMDFLTNIKMHSQYLVGESFNLGFKNMLAGMGLHGSMLNLINGGGVLIVLTMYYYLVKNIRSELMIFVFNIPLIYFLLTLSPYYFQVFGLVGVGYYALQKNEKYKYVGILLVVGLFLFLIINTLIDVQIFTYLSSLSKTSHEFILLILSLSILLLGVTVARSEQQTDVKK